MHLDSSEGLHRITGYGSGYVSVDEHRLTRSFVLAPRTLITEWRPQSVSELDAAAMQVLIDLGPSIVLLGTGADQRFPPNALLAPVLGRGVGVEVMATDAACRTFNILVAEGRTVAAGMFIP